MKSKKITIIAMAFFLGLMQLQAQKVFEDLNGYVDSKNTGGTGYVNLTVGSEERAAQTYHYSGPGKVNSIRVYGAFTGIMVPLRVSIYNVDNKGRPTSEIKGENFTWWFYNTNYKDVSFSGGGVTASTNFAVVVSVRTGLGGAPYGTTFQIKYTGNGEGKGQDFASLAGTTTGGNWTSAMSTYNKDGDFYLVPKMSHDITAGFSLSNQCASTSTNIEFSNSSKFSMDSMFNTIGWSGYKGSAAFYSWNFGDGGVSNLKEPTHTYTTAGNYTVKLITTIAGWNGSKSDTFSKQISVGLAVNATGVTNSTCFGSNNGLFTAAGTGGIAPYKYSLNGQNYQSTASFNGLPAGSYTLYVQDASGCTASSSLTITQPQTISFSSMRVTDASCNTSDGAILAVASGGVGSLQYKLNGGSSQSSGSFTGLNAGSYLITATDANSCSNTGTAIINNSGSPVLTVSSVTKVSCNGGSDGSITLSASGGTGTLQYSINGGSSFQSGGSFTGLAAGKYIALVKDAAGCTQGQVVELTSPGKIDFFVSSNQATCFGKQNGEIHISSAIGGIGKLTYSINGTNYQSSPDFTGLKAGSYTVYTKDVASCVITKNITVTSPSKIISSKTVTDAVCNGSNTGSIRITATGGTPSYTFSNNGGSYQATGFFNEVGAGNYNITVKDMNECLDTIIASISEPSVISASVNTTNSTCGNNNGSLLVTASGGTGSSYTYSLDGVNWVSSGQFTNKPAGTYYIVVKDAAGCLTVVSGTIMDSNGPSFGTISSTNVTCNKGNDGSITVNSVSGGTGTIQYSLDGVSWQTSNQFKNLGSGSYVIIIKDANGCRSNSNIVNLTQPNAIVITKTVVNVSCFGSNDGSATITAIGGAGTLAYSINGGTTFQSDKSFLHLYADNYTVIVRDAGGCSNDISFSITEPSPIATVAGILNIKCHGVSDGELTINASGGKPPYTYSIGNSYQTSNSFANLAAGEYNYFVKDANNCVIIKPFTVNQPDELLVFNVISDVSCAGGNNGVIDLTVTGGTMPYTYNWSNTATTEDIFNLKAGNYSVVVKDANRCTEIQSFTLNQPASPIIVNGVVVKSSSNNGSIDITVTGGIMPYKFLWSNGKTTEDITELAPGTYTVTTTDANGCVTSNQFTVENALGILSQETNSNLKLYPNPASESVNIELNGLAIQKVLIVNGMGQVVIASTPGSEKVTISTADLTPGMYYVIITADGFTSTRKMSIIK